MSETEDRRHRARQLIAEVSWTNPEAGQRFASQLDVCHPDDLGALLNRLHDVLS